MKERGVVHAISRTIRPDLPGEIHQLQADTSDYNTAHRTFAKATPEIACDLIANSYRRREIKLSSLCRARPNKLRKPVPSPSFITSAL